MSGLLNLETALNSLGTTGASAPMAIDTLRLTGTEVPSAVWIGGTQMLKVTELIGGSRVIQTLGPQPVNLEWNGILVGSAAQQRAQQLDTLRSSGRLIAISFGGYRYQAVISEFRWAYQQKGAVAPYRITCVVMPTPATTGTPTASELSNLVGPTIGNAITGLTSMASNVASYASGLIGQAQTIAGQAFPIANMLGAGGLVASVTDKLTAAQGLAAAGTNLSQAPAAAAGIITTLQGAGSGLSILLSQAGTNLDNMPFTFANLPFLRANGDVQTAAIDAGAQVNLAIVQTQAAAGMTVTPAVVHA